MLAGVTEREREVLGEALRLTPRQRARLAAELLASIEGEPDEGADAAWGAEIERRAKLAVTGKSSGTEWSIVQTRIQKSTRR